MLNVGIFYSVVVLTEIKFILHIKYNTDFFIFCYSQVGLDYLFSMFMVRIFKLFWPEYLFTKSTSPLPSDSNGRPFMAYSKLF